MKKVCACVLCAIILLAGCGDNAGMQNLYGTGTELVIASADRETDFFLAETWDAGITPEYQPLSDSFALAEDMLYYVNKREGMPVSVCGISLVGQGQPPQEIIRLEDGCIETVAQVKGAEGENILVLAGKSGDQIPFLRAYSMEGCQLWRKSYRAQGETALRLAQDESGYFYVMYTEEVLLFDGDGNCQGSISCPGKSYIDLCAADGVVYASYHDGHTERPLLTRLQQQGNRTEGELRIAGSGRLGAGRDGRLLFQDGNDVYACVFRTHKAERLLDLSAYDLAGEQLQAMEETSSGEIRLINWEMCEYDSPAWITTLKMAREGQMTEDGRQVITWLVIGAEVTDEEQLAAAFNRQSKDYRVVVEQVSLKGLTSTVGDTQYDLDTGIYMCVNTRLLAKESADLLSFLNYQDMERYLTKGYLEDLSPYIAQSEQISQDDYLEQVLACYSRGDALYSIPPAFGIDTLIGKESELGAEPGWTVEEFLEWLSQHPDAVTKEGMSKQNVLEFCLRGTLEEYLNWESGECDFEGEDFQELMRQIQGLTVDGSEHWDDWERQIEEKKPVLEQGRISGFSNCNAWESMYGEPLVYKGYPSKDGEPCHYYVGGGLGVLSRSTCKEGAYAFWEYCLLYHSGDGEAYYTRREDYADSMARIADEQYAFTEDGKMKYRKLSEVSPGDVEEEGVEWISNMTEEQRDKQLAMLEYVRADTLDNQAVRNIICEEAAVYFAGAKGLEDTCRVIQSRVHLYITEQYRSYACAALPL